METLATKPSRLKKIILRTLFVLAALVTLVALAYAEENWRGARAWESYKRVMEAKGDQFDAARLIPPKVPDDENFAMTPLFAPLFTLPLDDPHQPLRSVTNTVRGETYGSFAAANFATNIDMDHYNIGNHPAHPLGWKFGMASDLPGWAAAMQGSKPDSAAIVVGNPVDAASLILEKLKTSEPLLAELQSAAARRYCRFNVPYEEWKLDGIPGYMEHLTLCKWLIGFLALHAETEMALGRTDQAVNDINVMFRVDDGLKDEPLDMSQLVRMSCITRMLGPVGEGLAEGRWSEEQLRVLQERLQETDLIASTVLGLHGERDICYNGTFDQGVTFPRGWYRFEQVNVNRAFQDAVFARFDLAAREIEPSIHHSIDLTPQTHREAWFSCFVLHHNLMATMMIPAYSKLPQQVAFAQSEVDMAMLACALERYRLAQGQYPEDIKALVPRFVAVLPHDIINGQPLKYRRTDDRRFILYSVGWNEKDDGGAVAARSSNTNEQDVLRGDWVWQYPKKL
jgi:hypothetical protein